MDPEINNNHYSYSITERKPLTVKEMDADQQPREKAEKFGCGVLSVPELWAIILRTGTPGYPITDLCRDLMRKNKGSLHRLERRTRNELKEIRGIGITKCIQVEAVMELIKRYSTEEIPQDEPIVQSEQIFIRMRNVIGNIDHEEIWALYLNRRNQIIKERMMTTGTGNASIFDLKMAIKHALLENADAMILCHNHPSGSKKPSVQDDKLTADLKNACKFMNIRLLDHVIVTADGFFSYRDSMKL